MKSENLVIYEYNVDSKKEVNYDIINFPDGEKHIVLDDINRRNRLKMKIRIKSSDDLFILMQLADIIKRQCLVVDDILIYYLMTMRCDRLFSINEAFSLRIVTDIIASLNPVKVYVVESHSRVSCDLMSHRNRMFACSLSSEFLGIFKDIIEDPNTITCFPDEGASRRYLMSLKDPIICEKKRDKKTGKIISLEILNKGEYKEGNSINVLDDLCDGGGTFIGVAKRLRKLNPSKLTLSVVHAVQREGIERVSKVYDEVYITDSYQDWKDLPQNVHVNKIEKYLKW